MRNGVWRASSRVLSIVGAAALVIGASPALAWSDDASNSNDQSSSSSDNADAAAKAKADADAAAAKAKAEADAAAAKAKAEADAAAKAKAEADAAAAAKAKADADAAAKAKADADAAAKAKADADAAAKAKADADAAKAAAKPDTAAPDDPAKADKSDAASDAKAGGDSAAKDLSDDATGADPTASPEPSKDPADGQDSADKPAKPGDDNAPAAPTQVTALKPTFHEAPSFGAKATVEVPQVTCVSYWIGQRELATGSNDVANDASVTVSAKAGDGCELAAGTSHTWSHTFTAPEPPAASPAPASDDPTAEPTPDPTNTPPAEPTTDPSDPPAPTESASPDPSLAPVPTDSPNPTAASGHAPGSNALGSAVTAPVQAEPTLALPDASWPTNTASLTPPQSLLTAGQPDIIEVQWPQVVPPTCDTDGSFDFTGKAAENANGVERDGYHLYVSPAPNGPGTYTFTAYRIGSAGNLDHPNGTLLTEPGSTAVPAKSLTFTVTVDKKIGYQFTDPNAACYKAPPTIAPVWSGGGTYCNTGTITADATFSAANLARYYAHVDNRVQPSSTDVEVGGSYTLSYSVDLSTLSDGPHTVYYSATDTYGNKTEKVVSFTVDSSQCSWPTNFSVKSQCDANGRPSVALYVQNDTPAFESKASFPFAATQSKSVPANGAAYYFASVTDGSTKLAAGTISYRMERSLVPSQKEVSVPYDAINCGFPAVEDVTKVETTCSADHTVQVQIEVANQTPDVSNARAYLDSIGKSSAQSYPVAANSTATFAIDTGQVKLDAGSARVAWYRTGNPNAYSSFNVPYEAKDCTESVTATPATALTASTNDAECPAYSPSAASFEVPDIAGVQYYLGDDPVAPGTVTVAWNELPYDKTLTAKASGEEYELTNPDFSQQITFDLPDKCTVTAVDATVTASTNSKTCPAYAASDASFTVADTPGVQYLLDGAPVSAGEHVVAAADLPYLGHVLTAKAASDDAVLTNSDWSQNLNLIRPGECGSPTIEIADPGTITCDQKTATATVTATGTSTHPFVALWEIGPNATVGDTATYTERGKVSSAHPAQASWTVAGLEPESVHTWVAVGAQTENGPLDWGAIATLTVTAPAAPANCPAAPVVPVKPVTPTPTPTVEPTAPASPSPTPSTEPTPPTEPTPEPSPSETIPATGPTPEPSPTHTVGAVSFERTSTGTTTGGSAASVVNPAVGASLTTQLPYTGFGSALLAGLAACLVAMGAVLVVARRRAHDEG